MSRPLAIALAALACASPPSPPEGDASPWARVELLTATAPRLAAGHEPLARSALPANDRARGWLPADLFVKEGAGGPDGDPGLGDVGHLATDADCLLASAPGWDAPTHPTPVLLVHGAGDDLNRAWAHPFETQTPATPATIDRPGLMQYLSARGYAVFAVSFPHTQGNNLTQAELVATALRAIREKTGAAKVDVVAHSKGNVAALAYLSSLHAAWPETATLSDYAGDVRRYVAVAAPFAGVDTMFRSYGANLAVLAGGVGAPLALFHGLVYGAERDFPRWSMTSARGPDHWQGQTQLLHDWVRDAGHPIPLGDESRTSFDADATMRALYDGGATAALSSDGIDAALLDARSTSGTSDFMRRLDAAGVDPGVDVRVLYGTSASLGAAGESADPSDGLLFVASATRTSGIARRGAHVARPVALPLNHLQLTSDASALDWIERQLR